ncbi:MAG: hypothetical protein JXB38_14340 [Anaerolineales bacterium]|nr:hypothetical protein [Anaerolineales bacterium]
MSENKHRTAKQNKAQHVEKSTKRGVSATFITWLLDGFTQMETAKVKIDHR